MFKNPIVRSLATVLLLLVCGMLHAERVERVFFSYNASHGLADNSAQTIKCTKTGRMVITTIGHVNFYDGANFVHIDPTAEDDFPLPKYFGHYHIYFDKHHHLWVKDKRKVTCVDLMKERFISNVDSVIKQMGMKDVVEDMFGDGENAMWFMLNGNLYCPERKIVVPVGQKAELHDIDTYENQLLQFFSNGYVSAYNLSTGKHLYDATILKEGEVERFSESSVTYRDGRFFYQIRNGSKDAVLMRFDAGTREWKELMYVPYHLNNMVLHGGLLYIASEYGYWEVNPISGEKTQQEYLLLDNGRKLMTDINTIAFDRQGGMWIGTERRGLLYARPFASPFRAYTWEEPEALRYAELMDRAPEIAKPEALGRHVNCKFVDSRGWTWSGLYTGVQLDRPNKKPYLFTVKDGMMNDMTHCVIEDEFHDIWVGTSYGICHMFIDNDSVKRVESYYDRDNIPSESFVNRRAIKLNDGTIVMQSLDHVVTFNPRDFHNDSILRMKLIPKLVRLTVNGRDAKPGLEIDGRVILENAVTRTWEISVGYNQNTLYLTFSGLNYMRPSQTYYRYRVKGLNDEWTTLSFYNSRGQVDSRGLLHLPLIGLKPGKYVIEVQASMTPEEWAVEPISWTLKIEEPWWRTTGLYALLAVLAIIAAVVNFYIYNRNLRLRMKVFNNESEMKHRLTTYALRCKSLEDEVLTPHTLQSEGPANTDYDFADIMTKIVPFVQQCKEQDVSFDIQQLSEVAGVDVTQMYQQLSVHLNESPRLIILRLRLAKAAALLAETEMTKEEIAEQLCFVSTNYLIASFFHQYRQTPDDYRNSMAL